MIKGKLQRQIASLLPLPDAGLSFIGDGVNDDAEHNFPNLSMCG